MDASKISLYKLWFQKIQNDLLKFSYLHVFCSCRWSICSSNFGWQAPLNGTRENCCSENKWLFALTCSTVGSALKYAWQGRVINCISLLLSWTSLLMKGNGIVALSLKFIWVELGSRFVTEATTRIAGWVEAVRVVFEIHWGPQMHFLCFHHLTDMIVGND